MLNVKEIHVCSVGREDVKKFLAFFRSHPAPDFASCVLLLFVSDRFEFFLLLCTFRSASVSKKNQAQVRGMTEGCQSRQKKEESRGVRGIVYWRRRG